MSGLKLIRWGRHIDGIALNNQEAILKNLFDAKSVLDPVRPPLKAGS